MPAVVHARGNSSNDSRPTKVGGSMRLSSHGNSLQQLADGSCLPTAEAKTHKHLHTHGQHPRSSSNTRYVAHSLCSSGAQALLPAKHTKSIRAALNTVTSLFPSVRSSSTFKHHRRSKARSRHSGTNLACLREANTTGSRPQMKCVVSNVRSAGLLKHVTVRYK